MSLLIIGQLALIVWAGLLFQAQGVFAQRSTFLALATVQVLGLGAASLIVAQRRSSVRYAVVLQGIAMLFVGSTILAALFGAYGTGTVFVRTLLPLSIPVALVLFPAGRTSVRFDARVTLPVVAAAGAVLVALFLVAPAVPGGYVGVECPGPTCGPNGMSIVELPGLVEPLTQAYIVLRAIAVLACLGTIVYRVATLRGARRRELLPMAVVGSIMLSVMLALSVMQVGDVWNVESVDFIRVAIQSPLRMALPFALVLGLTLGEFSRGSRLERDFASIRASGSLGDLEQRLQAVLDDPELRVHASGVPAGDAAAVGPVRETALLTAVDGRVLGMVTHREGLAQENPVAFGVAIPAATLAVEQIDLERQVHELELQVTEARAEIASATEAERARVEQDLHDGAQARVIMLKAKVDRLAASGDASSATGAQLDAVRNDVDALLADVRSVTVRLKGPPSGQLCHALRDHAMDLGAAVTVRDDGIGPMSAEVETAVWFCVNEALQNALKHGGPDVHVAVTFGRRPGWLLFDVRDDGPAVSAAHREGRGIIGMRDRLAQFEGRLIVGPELDGSGFRVRGEIPLAASVARA